MLIKTLARSVCQHCLLKINTGKAFRSSSGMQQEPGFNRIRLKSLPDAGSG